MYAKINGGTVVKFPYTFGDLRKDHPNVSFPKNITQGIMQKYGMVGVLEGPKPTLEAYQTVQRNALPTRPVIGQYTEEDAPMPEMVGEDIIAGYWMIEYNAVDMFADTTYEEQNVVVDNEGNPVLDEEGNEQYETVTISLTKAEQEAEYQAKLDETAAKANRKLRNEKLEETDYFALTDVVMDEAMKAYRQALRDITVHANWPHLGEEDWPVKV